MHHHLFQPMVVLVYYLTNLLFFDIPLLNYHYINLSISTIRCIFSGGKYHSLGIFLSNPIFSVSFVTISEVFYDDFIEKLVLLSATLFQIKFTDSAPFWRLHISRRTNLISISLYEIFNQSFESRLKFKKC